MKENDNTYIPQSLVKGVIPLFHIDNIGFIEDMPDGKGATYALILSVFQPLVYNPVPVNMDVDQKTSSLILKANSFNELQQYSNPHKLLCTKSNGCNNFKRSDITYIQSRTFQI